MRTLVIGVGNLLRTDDGAGIHVINQLIELHPRIETVDAAMGSIEIIEAMRGYERAIIVDAIETGTKPGTIYRVNLTGGERPPTITHSHGTDLLTILQLGHQLYGDEMPREIVLIAIEAGDTTTIGDEPTPEVREAISEAVTLIADEYGKKPPVTSRALSKILLTVDNHQSHMVKLEGFDFPDDLYYHREHMWVKVEGDKVRVGYNDWAQKAAGKLLSLKTKRPGAPVEMGKTLGSVESGKWVGSLKVPVSGELLQLNEEVLKNPGLINSDPYGKGWVAIIKPSKLQDELKMLISGKDMAGLETWLKEERAKAKQ